MNSYHGSRYGYGYGYGAIGSRYGYGYGYGESIWIWRVDHMAITRLPNLRVQALSVRKLSTTWL